MSENQKHKFFYGWVVVIACMLIQAFPFGVVQNVHPQFISFVTTGEGYSLTQFSLLFTLGTVASAIASPFIGNILSKPTTNIKMMFVLGSILAGGGFLLNSYASEIWMFYIISAINQIGLAIISSIGVPLLISSWFTVNKGIAMGLAFSGGGLGNILLQQIAARLLNNPQIGYRGAYFIFGALAMAVAIPVSLLFIRRPKSDDELLLNTSKDESLEEKDQKILSVNYTFNEVKSMKEFWLFACSFLFVGLYVSGMSVQFSGYFYSIGLEPKLVANIASTFAFVSIFGNLFGGVLFDRLGIRNSLLLAGCAVVICGISLIFTPSINVLGYLFAAGLGFSMFAYIIGPSYLTGALFGNKEFGTILGVVQVFFAFGFAIGSSLFGVIVDFSGGNYIPAWISVTIFSIIAYVGLLISTSKIIKTNNVS
ncbi:MAG: conjugated bile salt MFS transporter [Peptostreptococcaceae bacterium]